MARPHCHGRYQVASVGRKSQITKKRPGRDRHDPPSRRGGATFSPGPSRACVAAPAEINPRILFRNGRLRKMTRIATSVLGASW